MPTSKAAQFRMAGLGSICLTSLWLIALLAEAGCVGGRNSGSSGTNVKGPQTYALPLPRQQVWQGLITFASKFPQIQPPYGNLTGFQNPNLYTLRLFNPSDQNTFVDLRPSASTTSGDVQKLYDTQTPALPVNVVAVPSIDASTWNAITVTVNYNVN